MPYIIDTSNNNNKRVGDSNRIIEYLESQYGVSLDKNLSPAEQAVSLAFERLVGEHLYWAGVVFPRRRMDSGWETYIPCILQQDPPDGSVPVPPEVRAVLDGFRVRIQAGLDGQGMGRRDEDEVVAFYRRDIDALSAFLGNNKYFMGSELHTASLSQNCSLLSMFVRKFLFFAAEY